MPDNERENIPGLNVASGAGPRSTGDVVVGRGWVGGRRVGLTLRGGVRVRVGGGLAITVVGMREAASVSV
jgi:hypothetical protein